MMTKSKILELSQDGENYRVEFKEEHVKSMGLAREAVAFANSVGGVILIGISDSGEIKGVGRKDMEEWVVNVCRENCYPSLSPIYEKVNVDGINIAAITIPKREGVVHRTSDGHYYIRAGSTVRDATPEELGRLFQFRGIIHHDTAPVYGTTLADIDFDRLKHYFSFRLNLNIHSYQDSLEKLLENIKAMVSVDDKYCLTVAGLVVFGSSPGKYLPQAKVTAVKFRGNEMDYDMEDKKEFSGPLINKVNEKGDVVSEGTIEQMIRFVQNHTTISSRMSGNLRKEIPQYPPEPIREAVVNSVAHRDYSISGSGVRLFIFSDRVEIRSPGRLPNTVTIENARRTAHFTRNPELYKFLAQFGYAEDIGLGIPQKIIKKMVEHTGIEPGLEECGEEFVLTLFAKRPENG